MAIIFCKNISPNCIFTLWKIEETTTFFLSYLGMQENDLELLSGATHPTKQLEWLASRSCAKHTAEQLGLTYYGIAKDEYRNPYLIDNNGYVSLSHTNDYAVVVISMDNEVGVDIELISEKLSRVAHKFLSDPEHLHAQDDLETMCIYWCAKESLYKWYGKKNLSFKENIFIEPFEKKPQTLIGEIFIDQHLKTDHQLYVFYQENYIITLT